MSLESLASALLIVAGGALLVAAAVLSGRVVKELRTPRERRAWRLLRGLMLALSFGYAAVIVLALTGRLTLLLEVVGLLFAGGGAFVFLVVRVSRRSLTALSEASTSRRHFEHILDGLRDAVLLVDEDGKILAFNRALLDLSGYTAADLRGRRGVDLLTHVPLFATQGARARPRDQELVAHDGTKIPVAVVFHQVEAPEGARIQLLCVLEDRREDRRRERRLEQAVAAAEGALRARRHLAERIREETGGPLQALRSATEALRGTVLSSDQAIRLRSVEAVERSLHRAVENLVAEAQDVPSQPSDAAFDPRAALESAAAALAEAEPRTRTRTRVADGVPAACLGRAAALAEVLLLLGQYLLSCGHPEWIELAVEPVPGDRDHLLFSLGVDEVKQADDPGRSHVNSRVVGASLSLSTARLLVHAVGGRLWIVGDEADPARICFTAVLPAAALDADDEHTPSPDRWLAATIQQTRPDAPALRGAVLVVDDSAQVRLILESLLVKMGYQVTLAASAAECLALVGTQPFRAVLLDMLLPDGTGLEVLTELRKRHAQGDLTVIMISALEEPASIAACFELGADDYLIKPVNPTILRARLGNASEKQVLHDRNQIQLARLDELLRVILPAPIARELQATNTVTPRRHEDVAVMFADVVGFTAYCEAHPPEEVLVQLQRLVAAFERLCERHGVQKIKTIGDALMASAGLLDDRPSAVARCVDLGHALLDAIRDHPAGWDLRIGIHVGRVVSGIVGSRQFLYDIWGDTVNTAQRIEHSGEVGRVCVSAAARARLPPTYVTRDHVVVEAKGKGPLEIFVVEPPAARRPDAAEVA